MQITASNNLALSIDTESSEKKKMRLSSDTLDLTKSPLKSLANTEMKLPDPVSDHQFLNNIRPEQAREFLLSQITRKLDEISTNHISNNSNNKLVKNITEYTEKAASNTTTANQIINHINQMFNNTSGSTLNTDAVQTIRNNVNSEFSESRNVFAGLNGSNNEFLMDFDLIQKNVNGFLDKLLTNSHQSTSEISYQV